jgi:hypothetical protein
MVADLWASDGTEWLPPVINHVPATRVFTGVSDWRVVAPLPRTRPCLHWPSIHPGAPVAARNWAATSSPWRAWEGKYQRYPKCNSFESDHHNQTVAGNCNVSIVLPVSDSDSCGSLPHSAVIRSVRSIADSQARQWSRATIISSP